jgi:Zn-dependent protease
VKALLALLAAGKLGKFLITGGTMVLSVFTYALVFGIWYAVGLVALIFLHEMGHYIAAKNRGLSVGAPTFIPFVGAWIQLKDQPMNAETEAFVGIAGPMLGSAAALVCYLLAREMDSHLLLALAYAGFMINLFNLLPISPLDGGRIVSVISPRLWLVGAPLLVGLFFWRPSPLLILIAILAAPQVIAVLRGQEHKHPDYYRTDSRTRISYGLQYLALAGFLSLMAFELHEMLSPA